jgi:four helix bundle protein
LKPVQNGAFLRASVLAHAVLCRGAVAKDYTGLVVWQLADELRVETLKLTRKPAFARDFSLRGEIEKTISSICRNIPEGFRRKTNREFARFLEYSYGSSGELKSLFEDAQLRNS